MTTAGRGARPVGATALLPHAYAVLLAIVPPHQCAVLAPLKQWGYVYFSRSRLTKLPARAA